jgi:hypothetical protein
VRLKIQAPMPRPTGTIMCIGKNYADHIKEVDTWKSAPGISTPEAPEDMIIFTKAPQSVIGPGAAINYPHGWSELVDYEAGVLHPSCLFIVVLGFLSPLDQSFLCLFVSCLRACSDHQNGHGIQKEDALDHIFGSVHWSFQWMLYLR